MGDFMSLYKPDKLYVGETGRTKEHGLQKEFKPEYTSIVTIYEDGFCYEDIFSDEIFLDFDDSINDTKSIFKPKPFYLFMIELLKNNNDNFINEIYEKTLNNKYISTKELKQVLYILNGVNVNNHKVNSKYFTILSNKKFKLQPCIGRDNEINTLIHSLAERKKLTLLIGERGVGKTTIIDELVYRIKNNNIPKFLKKQMIIELDLSKLFFNPKDTKNIENAIIETIEFAKKNKAIIFIDKIDDLNKYDLKIFKLIKQAIEHFNLKVIGTTNNDNNSKEFLDDIFNKIKVEEPTEEILYEIINQVFKDYSKNNNINIPAEDKLDTIINVLIRLTNPNNRLLEDTLYKPYNDTMNNPGLVIEIIDKIFADAKVNNQNNLTRDNIIFGINNCNKITDEAKQSAKKEVYETFGIVKAAKIRFI